MDIANVRPEVSREIVNGLPAQHVDRAAQAKARVRPVEGSAEAARSALDKNRLNREEERSKKLSSSEMQEVLDDVQSRLDKMGTNLQFAMDKVAEDIVIKVTNKDSGELIRQIPSEDVIRLRKKLEELSGILFEGKA